MGQKSALHLIANDNWKTYSSIETVEINRTYKEQHVAKC